MTIKELIKQLDDMQLLYGDKVILTVTDGELDYRVKDINDCISREAVFKIFDEACYIDGDWYVMREKIEKLPSITPSYNGVKSELESCEDCISRKELLNALEEPMNWTDSEAEIQEQRDYDNFVALINSMPTVTPKSEDSWKEIKIKFECDDCISRQAVLDLTGKSDWFESSDDYNDFAYAVCNLPSVKPTRPKGKWKILDECANEGVYCSKCHKTVFKLEFSHTMKWRNFNYCPNCGADMRGDSE